jgi:hypothetical protein
MKRLIEQNFYEVLGIEFDASSGEITRAYKENHQLYDEDSLVSYSLFSKEEREVILARVNEAYSTLIDEKKRSRYDQSLVETGVLKEGTKPRNGRRRADLPPDSERPGSNTILAIRDELKARASSNAVVQEILSHEVLRGKDLKRIREELGVSLEIVTEMTKIRGIFLHAIEEDQYEKAPSGTFLKSYVKAYAQSIGLDAASVAGCYLKGLNG